MFRFIGLVPMLLAFLPDYDVKIVLKFDRRYGMHDDNEKSRSIRCRQLARLLEGGSTADWSLCKGWEKGIESTYW